MQDAARDLLPRPRSVESKGPGLVLGEELHLRGVTTRTPALERLADGLRRVGVTTRAGAEGGGPAIELGVDPALATGAEGYRLAITAAGVRLSGADAAGLAYGLHTLSQLVAATEHGTERERRLPGLEIEDRPFFPERGAMLDVSRNRVPRLETLFRIVDLLSGWKLNRLQLYTEHTFAYAGHEAVWHGWDPLTPEDVRRLDAYCAERHIELVPNQQSLGHMHHWLVKEPYRALAELPEGVEHPFRACGSHAPEPFSLCPIDPASLDFLAGLYDQLLPCFRSTELNVGLDETNDIGRGRSGLACRERGVGAVYLEFLTRVHGLAAERGRRIQFWADIALRHPEILEALPEDVTALAWGYEADHPLPRETRRLRDAGVRFQVCPGTSSWQSFAGRARNTVANVAAAAQAGAENGAAGILVTDWGDRGHLQTLPASFLGWAVAADEAWSPGAAREPAELARLLALHAFHDPSGASGRATLALAGAGEASGARVRNASPLALLFLEPLGDFPPKRFLGLSVEGLEQALAEVDRGLGELAAARPGCTDAGLVTRELVWTGGILRLACRLGIARLRAGPGGPFRGIPAERRGDLAAELAPLIEEHRRLWLERSRRGGLERASAWLERVAGLLDD